jgi:hypothetical protein
MRRRPFVANKRHAIYAGIACYLAGSLLLWDAYEHRGGDRPFALRWLPNV